MNIANEKKLNKIQEEITFWNGTLDDIRHKLTELYEERTRVEDRLRNLRNSSTNCNLYSPIHYYYRWDRTTIYSVISEEERLIRINEEIAYFNKEMNHVSYKISKLYAEEGVLLC